jgi:hypothetical protein
MPLDGFTGRPIDLTSSRNSSFQWSLCYKPFGMEEGHLNRCSLHLTTICVQLSLEFCDSPAQWQARLVFWPFSRVTPLDCCRPARQQKAPIMNAQVSLTANGEQPLRILPHRPPSDARKRHVAVFAKPCNGDPVSSPCFVEAGREFAARNPENNGR